MPVGRTISKAALLVEDYVFPLYFFYFAVDHIKFVVENFSAFVVILRHVPDGTLGIPHLTYFSLFVLKFVLILFNLIIAWALVTRRNLKEEPTGFLEIGIPLLGTLFRFTFNLVEYVPDRFNALLVPASWLPILALSGALVAIAGVTISALSSLNLRRSFSIFVEVRDIVTHGLYRYVRHPIYFGYLLSYVGLFVIAPRVVFLALAFGGVSILVYRASLEERKLASASPDYREYMRRVPFLLPGRRGRQP